jgi:hypothetical protein
MDLKNRWLHVVGEQIGDRFHDNFTIVCQNNFKSFLALHRSRRECCRRLMKGVKK